MWTLFWCAAAFISTGIAWVAIRQSRSFIAEINFLNNERDKLESLLNAPTH